MSSVGFRYILEETQSEDARPTLRVLFFIRSRTLGQFQSYVLADILGLLASDALKEFVETMFEELQELMRRAFTAGLKQAQWEFFTEWDMHLGWQIRLVDINSADPKFFGKVVEIENYLISNFHIQPSPQAFQADVHAPTIPRP